MMVSACCSRSNSVVVLDILMVLIGYDANIGHGTPEPSRVTHLVPETVRLLVGGQIGLEELLDVAHAHPLD